MHICKDIFEPTNKALSIFSCVALLYLSIFIQQPGAIRSLSVSCFRKQTAKEICTEFLNFK